MRSLRLLFALFLSLLVGLAQLRARAPSPDPRDPDALVEALAPGQRHLARVAAEGAGAAMQAHFPEGFFFTHALLGLSAVELALALPAQSPARSEARARAADALAALDGEEGRRPFDPSLQPPYGVFYAGWTTWLRAQLLRATPPRSRAPEEERRTAADCAALADAHAASPTPFLQSYPHQVWPCDSAVAMAALAACARVLGEERQAELAAVQGAWVVAARARLDPRTQLLPHTADSRSGAPTSPARGSSVALMARVLHEVDPELGRAHYEGLRRHFLRARLGVPGVLEHLDGEGQGDVDSGPLIAGVSLSASAVGAGAARRYGDAALADAMLGAGEVLGLPWSSGSERRYLFGWLPVADGFALWARSALPIAPVEPPLQPSPLPGRSARLGWNGLSVLLVVLGWAPWLRAARVRP